MTVIYGIALINVCCILGMVSIDPTTINQAAVLIAMMSHMIIWSETDRRVLLYRVRINNVTLGLRRLVMSHWRYADHDDWIGVEADLSDIII
jgi:hypothetical protein